MRGGECSATAALATSGLSLAIGGAQIVTDVSLEVAPGELLGLIGPNGAGKTTLFNLLSGLVRPTAGDVWLGGERITGSSPQRPAAAGLGRTFQTSSLFDGLTAHENVRLAAQARLGGSMRLWGGAAGLRETAAVAGRCLEEVGLAGRAQAPVAALAHGDKRKLELAVVLASEPGVVLLDEPMAGVSAEDVPDLVALIGRMHRERGATTIMVEHHMDVVLGLADRVAVMHHGALLACASPEEVMADPTVQSAYLGEGM